MDIDHALTREEMRALYGAFYEQGFRQSLNAANVPENFWVLLPYAEFWGILDDWTRQDLIDDAPEDVKRNLVNVVNRFEEQFDEWLAGPEANSDPLSDEYVAFTALRMAADLAG